MDKDGNGYLDTGEFRDAMDKLGMTNITGTTVSTILTAMDIHGPITMEEFLQIVDVSFPSPEDALAAKYPSIRRRDFPLLLTCAELTVTYSAMLMGEMLTSENLHFLRLRNSIQTPQSLDGFDSIAGNQNSGESPSRRSSQNASCNSANCLATHCKRMKGG